MMVLLYCTALEPQLMPRSRIPLVYQAFCIATILFEKSDVNLQKIDEKKNLTNPFTKTSISRSSEMINQIWVYDTILIGFSPSRSCWKLCPQANHLTIVLIIIIYELINNKNYLIFFIIRLYLLTSSYVVMNSLGLLRSIKEDLLRNS